MNEFTKAITESFTERVKLPFVRTFIFYWIIFNWKAVAYFFYSKDSIYKTLDYIESSEYTNIYINFICPFGASLVFYLGFPWVQVFLYGSLKEVQEKRKNQLQSAKISNLQRDKDRAQLEREIEDEKSGKKTIEELRLNINKLELEKQEIQEIVLKIEAEKKLLLQTEKKNDKEISLLNNSYQTLKNDIENRRNEISTKNKIIEGMNAQRVIELSTLIFVKSLQFKIERKEMDNQKLELLNKRMDEDKKREFGLLVSKIVFMEDEYPEMTFTYRNSFKRDGLIEIFPDGKIKITEYGKKYWNFLIDRL